MYRKARKALEEPQEKRRTTARERTILGSALGSKCQSCGEALPLDELVVRRQPGAEGRVECRRCARNPPQQQAGPLATAVVRWRLGGRALRLARAGVRATQGELAAACGWSQARQSALEGRRSRTVSDAVMRRLLLALESLGASREVLGRTPDPARAAEELAREREETPVDTGDRGW